VFGCVRSDRNKKNKMKRKPETRISYFFVSFLSFCTKGNFKWRNTPCTRQKKSQCCSTLYGLWSLAAGAPPRHFRDLFKIMSKCTKRRCCHTGNPKNFPRPLFRGKEIPLPIPHPSCAPITTKRRCLWRPIFEKAGPNVLNIFKFVCLSFVSASWCNK